VNRPIVLLSAALAAVALTACNPPVESHADLCPNLLIEEALPAPAASPTGTWDVTYAVTQTEGAGVASIGYRDASGAVVTVPGPTIPFEYAMTARPPGTVVLLLADATVPVGMVTLRITAVSHAGGATENWERTTSCGAATVP
jgi:hypothetical protein